MAASTVSTTRRVISCARRNWPRSLRTIGGSSGDNGRIAGVSSCPMPSRVSAETSRAIRILCSVSTRPHARLLVAPVDALRDADPFGHVLWVMRRRLRAARRLRPNVSFKRASALGSCPVGPCSSCRPSPRSCEQGRGPDFAVRARVHRHDRCVPNCVPSLLASRYFEIRACRWNGVIPMVSAR